MHVILKQVLVIYKLESTLLNSHFMIEQNGKLILKISPQQGGLHSLDSTPIHEWFRPHTVSCLWQLAKVSLGSVFFRREKLHVVKEKSPQTNADSHKCWFLWCCIFYSDVEYFLNVFDVFFACRNKNYLTVLSVWVCVVQTYRGRSVSQGHMYGTAYRSERRGKSVRCLY